MIENQNYNTKAQRIYERFESTLEDLEYPTSIPEGQSLYETMRYAYDDLEKRREEESKKEIEAKKQMIEAKKEIDSNLTRELDKER